MSANPLDEIRQSGPSGKALLHHFGSARSVARAGFLTKPSTDQRRGCEKVYDFSMTMVERCRGRVRGRAGNRSVEFGRFGDDC